MQNENQKLIDLMKSLEIFTDQEIQALQKTVIKRFGSIEELVRTDNQGEEVQKKDNSYNLLFPIPLRER